MSRVIRALAFACALPVLARMYVGSVRDSTRGFRTANVQVMRIRAGLIVESYDYHDHAGMARALQA
jgi:ketosteroid isomerase-like protein